MQVSIFKYSGTDYFETVTGDFIDKISFTAVYSKKTPEIFEEYTKEDDVHTFHCGEFDLGFFLGSTTTSTNGDTIEDFLTPEDSVLMLCTFELGGKTRGGLIDQTSIDIRKNPHRGDYEVSFKTIGMLKHVIEHMEKYSISSIPVGSTWTFDDYITWLIGNDLTNNWFLCYNQLAVNTKVGQTVKVNTIRQRGLLLGGLNVGYSVWAAIKSFAQFMGFAVRADFELLDGNFPTFALKLFWLSDGGNSRTIKPRENNIAYTWEGAHEYVMLRTSQIASGTEFYDGIIIKGDTSYATYNYENNGLTIFYFDNSGKRFRFFTGTVVDPDYTPPPGWEDEASLNTDDIMVIDLGRHAWYYSTATNIAFAAILTLGNPNNEDDFTGINTIFSATAGVEYQYLVQGIKRVREIDIEFLPTDQTALHDYFTADGTTYRIDRFETDILSRTANIRAVEQ